MGCLWRLNNIQSRSHNASMRYHYDSSRYNNFIWFQEFKDSDQWIKIFCPWRLHDIQSRSHIVSMRSQNELSILRCIRSVRQWSRNKTRLFMNIQDVPHMLPEVSNMFRIVLTFIQNICPIKIRLGWGYAIPLYPRKPVSVGLRRV